MLKAAALCRVVDVRDMSVGRLGVRNGCCFEVAREGHPSVFLRFEAIAGSDETSLSLICDASELHRYQCGQHTR